MYLCNLPGIIPILQMPGTARMALPLFLAVLVWLTYNVVGFKHNGLSYLTGMLWPRNVPVAMRPLVGLIEFLSNIVLRPFSLAVRLFANMLAGHMLLVTFALLTDAMLFAQTKQWLLKPMSSCRSPCCCSSPSSKSSSASSRRTSSRSSPAVYIGLAAHPEH